MWSWHDSTPLRRDYNTETLLLVLRSPHTHTPHTRTPRPGPWTTTNTQAISTHFWSKICTTCGSHPRPSRDCARGWRGRGRWLRESSWRRTNSSKRYVLSLILLPLQLPLSYSGFSSSHFLLSFTLSFPYTLSFLLPRISWTSQLFAPPLHPLPR